MRPSAQNLLGLQRQRWKLALTGPQAPPSLSPMLYQTTRGYGPLLALWPGASHLLSLNLCFLICKRGG